MGAEPRFIGPHTCELSSGIVVRPLHFPLQIKNDLLSFWDEDESPDDDTSCPQHPFLKDVGKIVDHLNFRINKSPCDVRGVEKLSRTETKATNQKILLNVSMIWKKNIFLIFVKLHLYNYIYITTSGIANTF